MLKRDRCVLVVVDIQGKLAMLMDQRERLFQNVSKMVRGAKILGLPIILTEQYPKGLGPTIPEIRRLLSDVDPVEKICFSCMGSEEFVRRLEALGRDQVLLVGIETHVCVYQTARDLKERGFQVEIVADAVSSRRAADREVALGRMASMGIPLTTVEMALFELLGVAGTPEFKKILEIVR